VARAQRLTPSDDNPFDSFDELELLLFRQHGIISRRQALRLLSDGTIRHRLETGRWQIVHRGVYLTRETHELDVAQRRWVASLTAGEGEPGTLAGITALQLLGLRGFTSYEWGAHVLIAGRFRDRDPPPFVLVHRATTIRRGDVHANATPPCTAVGRSIVDAASWAGSDAVAAGIVAACFRQRLVTLAEVTDAVERQSRARRRALVLDVARDASDGGHSLPEVEFLRLCRRARFPVPKCQVTRIDAAGRRRYLDAYFEEYGLHVEIDGEQHLEASARWADMRRQNDLWIAGDRILRFPAWLVRRDPKAVADQVRAALLAAGWRPRRGRR
jgi:very-short-patch-repair endonuclease